MNSHKIYVPLDSAAVALGADEVVSAILAEASTRKIDVEIVRNGSRGMHWLEPLVEVEVDGKRIGYGPINVRDVTSLFDADFFWVLEIIQLALAWWMSTRSCAISND